MPSRGRVSSHLHLMDLDNSSSGTRRRLGLTDFTNSPFDMSPNAAHKLRHAEKLLETRYVRDSTLPDFAFGEPGWDLMLVLYITALRRQRLSAMEVRHYVGAPSTTTLRWIAVFRSRGYLIEERDPTDARKKYISASEKLIEHMSAFVSKLDSVNLTAD